MNDYNFPFTIIPSKTYSLPINREIKGKDFISFGADNQYPKFLLDFFYGSSLHNRIISTKQAQIVGHGLYSKLNKKGINSFIKRCNSKGDSLSQIFKKCTLDFLITGGFAFQVIFNKLGTKIVEIYYIDVTKLRFNPDQDKILYSKEWFTPGRKSKTIQHEIYREGDTTGSKIFYFKGDFSRDCYPIPEYIGSLAGIESSIEIAQWELNRIKNGLFPGLHVSLMTGDPGPEGKKEFETQFKGKFQGSNNAAEVLITYTKPGMTPPTITPIVLPDLDTQFNTLQQTVRDDLFYGHGFPPVLLGVMVPGQLGGLDFTQAQQQFTNYYVEPNRKTILDIFDRVLSVNFDQPDLAVLPLRPIGNVVDSSTILASVMTPKELRVLAKSYGLIDTVEVPEGEQLIGVTDLKPAPNKTNDLDEPANNVPPPKEANIGDPSPSENI